MKWKTRTWWMIVLTGLVLGAILFIAFSATQPETKRELVTLQDIYALLVTEDGKNRLELIQEEVHIIHMHLHGELSLEQEEQTQHLEEGLWTMDDITFLLNALDDKIDAIKAKTDDLP